MRNRSKAGWRLALAGLLTGAAAIALPAIGQNQDTPESLLPPGFGDAPANPPASPAPTPAPTAAPTPGNAPAPSPPVPQQPSDDPLPTIGGDLSDGGDSAGPANESEPLSEDELLQQLAKSDLPPRAQRGLSEIGVITQTEGGFAPDGARNARGPYWKALLAAIDRPMVSRWGSIVARRALASRTATPAGVNGADWAAERAALLLRLGEADAARMLIQEVDSSDYTRRLHDVAMDTYLATADPAGWCPLIGRGASETEDVRWELARAICAALSGEQSSATAQIDRANRRAIAPEIDLLLAEKAVGAGINGRRAVTIEWDGVDSLTEWRYGLSLATGIEPPPRLMSEASRKFQAWRMRAPMLPIQSRIDAADYAAAMGVMSSTAMIDLYSVAYGSPQVDDGLRARGTLLRAAYLQQDAEARLGAMQDLWARPEDPLTAYSMFVLTSHAAAIFPVTKQGDDVMSALLSSMLSAGLDRNAMRWSSLAGQGSEAWALLALADPDGRIAISNGAIGNFIDDDASEDNRKARFLVAGLAGLGRLSESDAADFGDDLSFDLTRKTRWSRAMERAVADERPLLVAYLVAAGMQGSDWSKMTPMHLYQIVRGLRMSGMEAEARMIAAEAVARG